MRRDRAIRQAFVELADTLVESYDLSDFLHLLAGRAVALLDVSEAGVVLADGSGRLRTALATARAQQHDR